jgi:hypothetical protein
MDPAYPKTTAIQPAFILLPSQMLGVGSHCSSALL